MADGLFSVTDVTIVVGVELCGTGGYVRGLVVPDPIGVRINPAPVVLMLTLNTRVLDTPSESVEVTVMPATVGAALAGIVTLIVGLVNVPPITILETDAGLPEVCTAVGKLVTGAPPAVTVNGIAPVLTLVVVLILSA